METEKFYSYIFHKNRYDKLLQVAYASKLYDYVVIVAWQSFMLFIYEKIKQHDEVSLKKAWHKIFTKKAFPDIANSSIYWANECDDDKLLSFFSKLYPKMDSNVINSARAIKKKRDIAAHVSKMSFDERSAQHYIHELTGLMENIEDFHGPVIASVKDLSLEGIQGATLSPRDLDSIFLSYANKFENISQWEETTALINELNPALNALDDNRLTILIRGIAKNSTNDNYQHFLLAYDAPSFLKGMYVKTSSNSVWEKFAHHIAKQLKDSNNDKGLHQYSWLFKEFNMPTYASDGSVELDSIVF